MDSVLMVITIVDAIMKKTPGASTHCDPQPNQDLNPTGCCLPVSYSQVNLLCLTTSYKVWMFHTLNQFFCGELGLYSKCDK